MDSGHEIILSNVQGDEGGELRNFQLVNAMMQKVNIDKFQLGVLDDVYGSFEKAVGCVPQYNPKDFDGMTVGQQLKQPVLFDYDGRTWNGKISWHKWQNAVDNNVWNTYSIKLPNDGYIDNQHHEKRENGNHFLKDKSHSRLTHALHAALAFFADDENISVRVCYLTHRSRMNIKVLSQKDKAWLQITFEHGYPEQSTHTGWYTKQKMLELLSN